MFRQLRIGAALFSACDAVACQRTPIDRTVIKTFSKPYLDAASIDMKKYRLHSDQAAAVLYIGLIEMMHEDGLLKRVMTEDYHAYQSLYQLYCYYVGLLCDRPVYFSHAQLLMNDATFQQIQSY